MDERTYNTLNRNTLSSGTYVQGPYYPPNPPHPPSVRGKPMHSRSNTNQSTLPAGLDASQIASAVDVLQKLRDGLSVSSQPEDPRNSGHLEPPTPASPWRAETVKYKRHTIHNRTDLKAISPEVQRGHEKAPPHARRSFFTFEPSSRRASGLFGPGGPATDLAPGYSQPENSPEDPKGDNYYSEVDYRNKRKYIVKLARCLLVYGAPVHRLERYLAMTAATLQVKVEFFYLPDHLTLYFENKDDTTEAKLVRGGGTDLGRWLDVHQVSKRVIANTMTVDQGITRLEEISTRSGLHSDWFLLLIYGLAAIGIGPFAYGARFVDLPVSFVMGMGLGLLQLNLAPRSTLFSVLFEVSAAIIMSFLGRMIGSIRNAQGVPIFCYSALTESAINLIQPGYWITNACLELMNRQIATCGARFMYALVYALLLAYGIAIGSSLYGIMDHDAVSATVCSPSMSPFWNLLFVPFFSIQVAILGGAKWSQIPPMVFITFCSYASNFLIVNLELVNGSFTIGNTVHGLVMGILGNLYARIGRKIEKPIEDFFARRRGSQANTRRASNYGLENGLPDPSVFDTANIGYTLAAAAMVPAMIVGVPSGLANRGSFLGGMTTADAIVRNTTSSAAAFPLGEVMTNALPVYLNVIQIGLCLAVGLSIGALVVYPFDKRRSGVMSW